MTEKAERLDKFICGQTEFTRSEVKKVIRRGEVTVNGTTEKKIDFKVVPDKDEVAVNGIKIEYKKFMYIMLNKPQGVVCSTRDGASPTVLSLVPPELMRKGLFPAGRLDKDTEGFVFLTDDGELAHRMLSPRHHVDKLYYCELELPYDESYKTTFEEGMTLHSGEKCLPAGIKKGEKENSAYVILREGMFHQIKRMFETLGNNVIYLKRLKIGGLELDKNLQPGECREILHKEVEKIV